MRRLCLLALGAVGDARQQWEEWTGYAYHIRRRLSEAEQSLVGPAVDCRGTDEGMRRYESLRDTLPPAALKLAAVELGL